MNHLFFNHLNFIQYGKIIQLSEADIVYILYHHDLDGRYIWLIRDLNINGRMWIVNGFLLGTTIGGAGLHSSV